MNNYDVIVVGAGPAGATSARVCAQHNLKTLLIDKEKIPRDKPCAGALTSAAAHALDFQIPDQLIERKCRKISIMYEKVRYIAQLEKPFVFLVNRKNFDAFLTDKAVEEGARLHDKEQCVFVKAEKNHVTVKTDKQKYTAGIVIGADGVYSRVLKNLHGGFDRDEIHLVLTAEIPLSNKEIEKRFRDLVTIYYGSESIGYAWLFPKSGYVSAGTGIQEAQSKTLVKRLKDFLKIKNLDSNVRIRGYFIPVSHFKRPVYGNRIMLTGDAAGFVDGFIGEGIRYAVLSGKLAAQTAIKATDSGDFSETIFKGYQDVCYSTFGRDLRCAAKITEYLKNNRKFILETALRDTQSLTRYFHTVAGDLPLCDFVHWMRERSPFLLTKRIIFGANVRRR